MTCSSVLLTSVDNPAEVRYGGKHIHLGLLQAGLQQSGFSVQTDYLPKAALKPHGLDKWFHRHWLARWALPGQRYMANINRMLRYYQQACVPVSPGAVINAHDVVAAACERRSSNLVLTLHGYFARETLNYNHFTSEEARRIERFCQRIEQQALRKAKALIAVDSRIADTVIHEWGYPAERVTVIHNAVDTTRFLPVAQLEQMALKQAVGIDSQRLVLLVPRRLVRKNGVVVAAEALQQLVALAKDTHLADMPLMVFLGSGPEKPALEQALQGLVPEQHYRWLEAVDHNEVLPWYQLADVVLVPSIRADGVEEATSLTMLEGMACGKAVVCSNIGGMAELMQPYAHTEPVGCLVPEHDALALRQCLQSLQAKPAWRHTLGLAARQCVLQHHSHVVHAQRFAQVYTSIL